MEMTVDAGQSVIVLSADPNKSWWLCESQDQRSGYLPAVFLEKDSTQKQKAKSKRRGIADGASKPISLARIMTEKLEQGVITREEHDHIIATSIQCVEAAKSNTPTPPPLPSREGTMLMRCVTDSAHSTSMQLTASGAFVIPPLPSRDTKHTHCPSPSPSPNRMEKYTADSPAVMSSKGSKQLANDRRKVDTAMQTMMKTGYVR